MSIAIAAEHEGFQIMRLIAVYNVFDGIELLEGSLRQIYSECFKVLIVYQVISNYGESDGCVEGFVRLLASRYRRIQLLKFEPDTTLSASQNEKNKRMRGIALARDLRASHFLLIDCDEYYSAREFRRAKQIIRNGGFDSSACRLYTYFKRPTYRLTPLEDYYVPFISSISLNLSDDYPVYADPTRLAKGTSFYEFKQSELMMHHFSWVRLDIEKKLRNSSAKVNWGDKIPQMVENYKNFELTDPIIYYPGSTLVEVRNQFEIRTGNVNCGDSRTGGPAMQKDENNPSMEHLAKES